MAIPRPERRLYHAPPVKVVLVSPYELGRQPFGLAHPAAWLRRAGFAVECLDLSRQTLAPETLHGADLVAIHLPMHTATRIAARALERVRSLAPAAHLCVYGLYAPMNRELFVGLGVQSVLGGEIEPDLLALAERVRDGHRQGIVSVHLGKIPFLTPDRSGLPPLPGYARLVSETGQERVVGFAEASRGCKHLCRHCPVVPVYEGRFRVIPVEVVLSDVEAQVAAGAEHVSFGDPDFLNGPTHALRVAHALHAAHPAVTYDATIKVEHLLRHRDLLPALAETGCRLVTSAVESLDDEVLERLAKNHTAADFETALGLLRAVGIAMAPTFVAFTPWTSLEGYRELLARLVELELVDAVPPVQLAIRLLVPQGSHLLQLPGFAQMLGRFDPELLGFPWHHPDPRVDRLHREVHALVEEGEREELDRRGQFERIWQATHAALGVPAPTLPAMPARPIPHHTEPWYCCAEPTEEQLGSF